MVFIYTQKVEWKIKQMTIGKFELIGFDSSKPNHGFSKIDIGILRSKKAQEKIRNKFKNVEPTIDFYFIMDYTILELPQKSRKKKLKLDKNPNNIVCYISSNGSRNVQMLNYWTIAHRFSHAVQVNSGFISDTIFLSNIDFKIIQILFKFLNPKYLDNIKYTLDTIVKNEFITKYTSLFLTMKSARTRMIDNIFDACAELLTQYLICGKIKLLRYIDWDHNILNSLYDHFINPLDYLEINPLLKELSPNIIDCMLENMELELNNLFKTTLVSLKGKVVSL